MFHTRGDRRIDAVVCLSRRALSVCLLLAFFSSAIAQVVSPNAGSAATAGAAATGQEPPAANQFQGEYFTNDLTEVFRLRHMEGDGQGDVPAYTNFGFTKFIWGPQGVLLLDGGARITNEGDPGFTIGAHRRIVSGGTILGAGLFYDEQGYHQGSLALELFTRNWAFRANGYAILGDDLEEDSEYSTTPDTIIDFEGNNILARDLVLEEFYDVAMSGVDAEIARVIGSYSSEAFLGGYYYEGDIGEHALGAKAGLRGFLMPDLAASLMVSGDELFGTNVFGGVTWFLGARGGLSRPDVSRRLTIPVERNEQIVVNEVHRREPLAGPIVLSHDDEEIEVVHVRALAAGTLEGTIENPFDALPDTQDADIVYVHADGVFANQSYTLAAEQRLLGEGDGNLHLVETDELGEIVLPAGNGGVTRPVIRMSPDNAVTLAEGSEVSNLAIEDAANHGIFGDGVTDFDVNRNLISRSGGSGIFLDNVIENDPLDPVAGGEVSDNVVTESTAANIEIVLAGDFEGEVSGNTANDSATLEGLVIRGPFAFDGDVSENTADGNFTDGIVVDVSDFSGDISGNTTTNNMRAGLALSFLSLDGEVNDNTSNDNGDAGIDISVTGNRLSEFELAENTAERNGAEGAHLAFEGTGTSLVEVLDNSFADNNGTTGREFFAENVDAPENEPTVYIRLHGNTSLNAPAAGSFNYEFDNEDLFDSDGEMILDLGANVGTVEDDDDVDRGEFP
jgi:hypothetical protein